MQKSFEIRMGVSFFSHRKGAYASLRSVTTWMGKQLVHCCGVGGLIQSGVEYDIMMLAVLKQYHYKGLSHEYKK